MTQDGSMQDRVERMAQALMPQFDEARMKLARALAAAEEGRLIEQSERVIFDELNRLKTTAQEIGLRERVHEVESAFSPGGAPRQALQQGDGADHALDAQRPGVGAGASLAQRRGR